MDHDDHPHTPTLDICWPMFSPLACLLKNFPMSLEKSEAFEWAAGVTQMSKEPHGWIGMKRRFVCSASVFVAEKECLQLCGTGALEAGQSDFNTYGRSCHVGKYFSKMTQKKCREPFGMEEKNDPGYGPFCCQPGDPSSISAPGDIGVTCATFAGVFCTASPGRREPRSHLIRMIHHGKCYKLKKIIRIKWVGQSHRRHVVDVCENSSWCDYSHQHTEVWLEIHALFGKLTMAAFNLCSENRGTPTRWDYFGQQSSRFPTLNQAWKTSTSCLGKHRLPSWTAQNEKLQEPTFRLFQPMNKQQLHTKGVYEKIIKNIWQYEMTIWGIHKKNEAQVSWLKSSHLRECYLLEMPILNDHAAETLDFLIFLVVTGLSQTFLKRLGSGVDEKINLTN